MIKSDATVEFRYDHNGLRTQKMYEHNGYFEATNYTYHGKLLIHMNVCDDILHFFYDNEHNPSYTIFKGEFYRYIHNLHGDIAGQQHLKSGIMEQIEELREKLQGLEDPRRTGKGNMRHELEDIIIIGLCSLICNGNDVSDMEDFGEARQAWLQQFLELPHGIPDSDTFRRMFERLNPSALAECLYDWLGQHRPEGSVIAIDGKTICGSRSENHKAYHVVSAFVAENQLTLGEISYDLYRH